MQMSNDIHKNAIFTASRRPFGWIEMVCVQNGCLLVSSRDSQVSLFSLCNSPLVAMNILLTASSRIGHTDSALIKTVG
jgi:hypothetical protein